MLSDFNRIPVTIVKDYIEKKNGIIKGRIIIGKILGSEKPSGKGLVTIIAREFSSTGNPTLEFQISNKKNYHIKY